MKYIKIFIAAVVMFGLQFTVASAASPVKAPGTIISANKPSPQVKHHRRHHYRHRPHRHHK